MKLPRRVSYRTGKFDVLTVAPMGSLWRYTNKDHDGGCCWFEISGEQIRPLLNQGDLFTVIENCTVCLGNRKYRVNDKYLKVIGPNSKIGYVIVEVFNEFGTWGKIVERINE